MALKTSCINSASISNSSFPLHTYLVGREAITKAFSYDLSPALHIAEAKVIELLSGTSFAQFLMDFPHLEAFFLFINLVALCDGLEKRDLSRVVNGQIGKITR